MQDPAESAVFVEQDSEPITLESVAKKIDIIGQQMDWLCESVQQVVAVASAMGSGGGLRGILGMMKGASQLMEEKPSA